MLRQWSGAQRAKERGPGEIDPPQSLSLGRFPLVDLLAGGGEWEVLLSGVAADVDLVHVGQELLGGRRVRGGGIVGHTVKPAMPKVMKEEEEDIRGR